jgi:hypothetical protein
MLRVVAFNRKVPRRLRTQTQTPTELELLTLARTFDDDIQRLFVDLLQAIIHYREGVETYLEQHPEVLQTNNLPVLPQVFTQITNAFDGLKDGLKGGGR